MAKNKKENLGNFLLALSAAQDSINIFLKMLMRVLTNVAFLREQQRSGARGIISRGFSTENPSPPHLTLSVPMFQHLIHVMWLAIMMII